jgi:hypothetical protein
MKKEKSDYAMVQIDKDVYLLLKEYCKENGYSLKGLVQYLIKQQIKNHP